jgi:hypothetical protein
LKGEYTAKVTRLKLSQLSDDIFTTEAELRKAIQKTLEQSGYLVKAISSNKRLYKQMKGLGDLEIRKKDWERGKWYKIEVKLGDAGFSDTEQEQSYYDGEIEVFRYLRDAEDFVGRN